MISIENVHKRYTTRRGAGDWVLRGVNMIIPTGRSVGLVGVNGAGKSTLLRIIGGADYPTRGRVRRYCRVSWPMANGGLEGTLTGRQNARFVCRIHGFQKELPERIARIEDFAELGKAFDDPIQTYSSGMRSRLQFALSLAFDFDVYISDEVTAAGDAAFRKKAQQAFQNLAHKASIIMVAHNDATLRAFCESGILLKDGKATWFDKLDDALLAYTESYEDDR
ncbi:ABC transporter ATP-binding protein [Desulfovibrio sp. ZJ369]|uniref:ABC transporter ATP-binding protein n=1 Tax=Desulfovibrio sp. ZJ369 TaxID=2709793 RepID=UPI0013EE20FB|nr:ABC transporter ATP-binding protein [Desulfovibrio sp. ZJ369]